MSKLCQEKKKLLVGQFKMVSGDFNNVTEKVLKGIHIPTGIKRELVRFNVNLDWKRQVIMSVWRGSTTIHSGGQIFLHFSPYKKKPMCDRSISTIWVFYF